MYLQVVYPDWNKGVYYQGLITRCILTRHKERVYDIDLADGSHLNNVKEDYLRALNNKSAIDDINANNASSSNKRSGGKNNASTSGSTTLPRLTEGMRLHALITTKGGQGKYLPSRVVKVNQNGSIDVEYEGGTIKYGLSSSEIMVGLVEGQEVEVKKPQVTVLHATDVHWNCNGSMIASSYGLDTTSGWCDNPGALCVWRIFNKNLNPKIPDFVLDYASSSLMCCKFHPVNPSIIACGSFNGEVMVFDLNFPESPIRISPTNGEETHTEPVADLDWVFNSHIQSYLLTSAGHDGKVYNRCTIHMLFTRSNCFVVGIGVEHCSGFPKTCERGYLGQI